MIKHKPWDVELRFGDASLARLTRALVKCEGYFTDSFVYSSSYGDERRAPVIFRVHIPEGKEAEFTELSRFNLLETPKFSIQGKSED